MQIYKKLRFKPSELPENAIVHVISDSDIKSYHYFQTVSGNYKYEHSINIINVGSNPFFFRSELFHNTARGIDMSLRFISYSAKKFIPIHFICAHYNKNLLVPVHTYKETKLIVDYMSLAEAAPLNVANWAESLSNALHDFIIDEFYADHMSELQTFDFTDALSEKNIRSVLIDGAPCFVGRDVAKALGYKDTVNALKQNVRDNHKILVDRNRVTNRVVPDHPLKNVGSGIENRITLIDEAGLYKLIFGSTLPTAEAFTDWVTSEVLPSLRKTGAYIITKRIKGGEQ